MPAPDREPCCLTMAATLEMMRTVRGLPPVVEAFAKRIQQIERRLSALEDDDGEEGALQLRPIDPDSFPDDWN